MSGKLDQSLDEILSTQRRTRGNRGRRVAPTGRTKAVVAPAGGVKKVTKAAKSGVKGAPTGPAPVPIDSKVVVSNLPKDVTEAQIKEYFATSVGPIKRVEISYGPNGVSRGIANITFARVDGANKALTALNGLHVDNRPMKIEILVDASRAASIPAPKGLKDRIAMPKNQPKSQPKSAASKKATPGTAATRGKGRKRAAGRNARPAKKTAEELDSEMADYFENGNTENATTNGTAQPAANGDAAMDDGIL